MNTWLFIDLLSFLFVVLLTGVLIPQILLIAFRRNLFDEPDERKIHTLPIPRLGGIAFLPTILFTVLLVCGIGMTLRADWLYNALNNIGITEGLFIGCSMLLLYIIGMADDLIGIRYRAKFIVQVIAALLLVSGGLLLDDLHGLFGVYEINRYVAMAFTVLLIVFITNAINLIDGIDGLASGLSSIACLIYGSIALMNGAYLFSLISFCSCGAIVSFFCFNVFGNASKHKKIFMGDTGALTIGIVLSAISLRLGGMSNIRYDYNPAVVAFAPLLVPCLDVVRVYMHRIRNNANPFLPDKNHIHHKLLAIGLHQRTAMTSIVIFSALLSITNIYLSKYLNITFLFIADILLWTIINLFLSKSRSKNREDSHSVV